MLRFNSDEFIKEMEELNKGIEESPLDYEEYEREQYEKLTERDLKNDL